MKLSVSSSEIKNLLLMEISRREESIIDFEILDRTQTAIESSGAFLGRISLHKGPEA